MYKVAAWAWVPFQLTCWSHYCPHQNHRKWDKTCRQPAQKATTVPSYIKRHLPFPSPSSFARTKSSQHPEDGREGVWSHTQPPSTVSRALRAKALACVRAIPSLSLDENLRKSLSLPGHSQVTKNPDVSNHKDVFLSANKMTSWHITVKTLLHSEGKLSTSPQSWPASGLGAVVDQLHS